MQRQIEASTGVCHFRCTKPQNLLHLLQRANYDPLPHPSEELLENWLELGAIYVNGRRQRIDFPLQAGALIRLHSRPKSFACEDLDKLSDRIVYDHADFLVLDKPAGLPTHPTLDNFKQNAKIGLEKSLGLEVYTTHRLDIPTQGLIVFAKNPEALKRINKVLRLGWMQKTYRALSTKAAPLGPHTHYMDRDSHVPRQIHTEPLGPHWCACELRVDKVEAIGAELYLHTVTLLTGRTHQIRAQMSFLGAPLIGDTTYGGAALESLPKTLTDRSPIAIGLECFRLAFPYQSELIKVTRSRSLVKHDRC